MSRFMDALRRGRDEAIAERKGRPLRPEYPGEPREDDDRPPDEDDYRPYDDPPAADNARLEVLQARIAELESALHQREAQCADLKQLIAELAPELEKALVANAALAAQLEQQGGEALTATLISVLSLPGVETWLRKRFHPDTHADASDEARDRLTEATKSINAAYGAIRERKAAQRN